MDGVGDSTLVKTGRERDEYYHRYCVAGNHRRNVQGQEAEQKGIRAWRHHSLTTGLADRSQQMTRFCTEEAQDG